MQIYRAVFQITEAEAIIGSYVQPMQNMLCVPNASAIIVAFVQGSSCY